MAGGRCTGSALQLVSERPSRPKNEVEHLSSTIEKDDTDRDAWLGPTLSDSGSATSEMRGCRR